jgi:hypothetical protein
MVTVEGVAESFADNAPSQGTLEIREVGATPRDTDAASIMATALDAGMSNGHFGPLQLKRNVQYVFTGKDPTGKILGWQYFTPFKRDNRLIRVLSPSNGMDGAQMGIGTIVAAQSTDKAKTSPSTVVVVARWAQGGFRQDLGASLKVDGHEVLTSDNSGLDAGKNSSLQGGVAALFLEDKNMNGKSDLGLVDYATFIAFTDVFIDAKTPGFVNMTFTAGSEDPVTVDVPIAVDNFPSCLTPPCGTSSQSFVGVMFQ